MRAIGSFKLCFLFEMIISIISTIHIPLLTSTTLTRALALLGELLEVREHPTQHFVVCGGSSLLALGLVTRTTTKDVDILARIEAGTLVTPRPLPMWLLEAASGICKT